MRLDRFHSIPQVCAAGISVEGAQLAVFRWISDMG
jgi:hypothetical protein